MFRGGSVCITFDFWGFPFFKKKRSLRDLVAATLKKYKASCIHASFYTNFAMHKWAGINSETNHANTIESNHQLHAQAIISPKLKAKLKFLYSKTELAVGF